MAKARSFANAETYNFGEYDDIVVKMKKATDFLGAEVAIDAVGGGGRQPSAARDYVQIQDAVADPQSSSTGRSIQCVKVGPSR